MELDTSEQTEIGKSVLALIRGCKDTTLLGGSACIRQCEYRARCRIPRTPFLIQAQSTKVILKKQGRILGEDDIQDTQVVYSSYSLVSRRAEEYINSLFEEQQST